ncbi:hypothetical protein N7G274_005857 [Stereocaulon virgatum]|uniref:Uncharacterized protein n=1 Tax=Stereocaulon virgatum TaxID=373712 RepID=A0ABR4A8N7_9LECA
MPPTKKQTNGASHEKPAKKKQPTQPKDEPKDTNGKTNGSSRKRKSPPTIATAPSKSRRSSRGGPTTPVDTVKLLNYLLSPSSLSLCRPKDETEDLKTRGANARAYSTSTFTPFEELVCALILSRPIGHMLGLRSIRTIFNEPYEYTTAKKIHEAGYEGVRKALDAARTQHRQKTAEEIVRMATMVVKNPEMDEDNLGMYGLREACNKSVEEERKMLKSNVKGLGKTGLDIFGRRVQGVWEEWYPFIDERTGRAVEELGLPGHAEELRKLVEEKWEELGVGDIEAQNEAEKKRKALVRILERAVGADLEGNVGALKAEAA